MKKELTVPFFVSEHFPKGNKENGEWVPTAPCLLPRIIGIGGLIFYDKRKYESGILSIKKEDFGAGISTP